MAQGRMLLKSISTSGQVADLADDAARVVFAFAIPHLDRDGRMTGNPRRLRGIAVPLLDHLDDTAVARAMVELVRHGLAEVYTDDDAQAVIWFPGFGRSQPGLRYDREKPSRFGAPPAELVPKRSKRPPRWLTDIAGTDPANSGNCRTAPDDSGENATSARLRQTPSTAGGLRPNGMEWNGREGKGSARARATTAPSPEHERITAELASHPVLARAIDVDEVADQILGRHMAEAKPLDWYLATLRDCADDAVAQRWPDDIVAAKVMRYVRNARAPLPSGATGPSSDDPYDLGVPDADGLVPAALPEPPERERVDPGPRRRPGKPPPLDTPPPAKAADTEAGDVAGLLTKLADAKGI